MKTILITGGAGFIGSHLCAKLLREGNKVICLDNLITGCTRNISKLYSSPNFKFIDHDITHPYYEKNINEIYNLACPASPVQYQKNPIKTIKTCTIGVINMLGLARKNNAKILQASTSEIYGNPQFSPQNEKYNGNVNVLGIRSCYDEGKRCSETLFMDYHREHGIKIKIARIFNTFGPNMMIDDGRVVSNFITQSLENKPLTVYGNGNQTRSFQYVDDLIEGLIKLMRSDDDFIGPVNLGSTDEISINELSKIIIKLTNSSSKIIYQKLPQDDPVVRNPDINLAKNKLLWNPKFDLTKGLLKTIKFFKK